jgi:hypothetical protein
MGELPGPSDPVTVNVQARVYDEGGEMTHALLTLAFDDDDSDRGRQLDARLRGHESDEVRGAILTIDLASLLRALDLLNIDAAAREREGDGDG